MVEFQARSIISCIYSTDRHEGNAQSTTIFTGMKNLNSVQFQVDKHQRLFYWMLYQNLCTSPKSRRAHRHVHKEKYHHACTTTARWHWWTLHCWLEIVHTIEWYFSFILVNTSLELQLHTALNCNKVMMTVLQYMTLFYTWYFLLDEYSPQYMWHDQGEWVPCRQNAILIFQYKSLVH